MERNDHCPKKTHVHEVQGSVRVAGCDPHCHRFATMTCEPVRLPNGDHGHKVTFRTDSYEGHYHEFTGCTEGKHELCDGHVHCLQGTTSVDANHSHTFKFVTLINDPTED